MRHETFKQAQLPLSSCGAIISIKKIVFHFYLSKIRSSVMSKSQDHSYPPFTSLKAFFEFFSRNCLPCTAIKVDLTKITAADISVFMHWAHFKYQPLLKANQLKRAPFESFLFVLGERLTQGRSIAANISLSHPRGKKLFVRHAQSSNKQPRFTAY